MNIHKSKGKEFDAVIIVEGQYRDKLLDRDWEPGRITGQCRLLRVAVTRARHVVVLVRPLTPWRSRLHCFSRLRTAGRRSRSWRSQRLALQIVALRRARVWLAWERPSPSPGAQGLHGSRRGQAADGAHVRGVGCRLVAGSADGSQRERRPAPARARPGSQRSERRWLAPSADRPRDARIATRRAARLVAISSSSGSGFMRGTSEVYQRSIAARTRHPWQSRVTRHPGHQALAIRTQLSAVRGTGTRLACGHVSRGYYGTYLAAWAHGGRDVCSMFARLSRSNPVARGTVRHRDGATATYLRRHYHEVAASSDGESNRAADS